MTRCPWCGGAYRAEVLAEFDIDGEPNTLCACGDRANSPDFVTDDLCDRLDDEHAVDPASCVVGWDDGAEPLVGGPDPIWAGLKLLGLVALVVMAVCAGSAMW